MAHAEILKDFYQAMLDRLGPSKWWPADSAFEVAVGAILTQNTNWKNVEKAIANLKSAGLMNEKALYQAQPSLVSELIRPAGYFRLKTDRLANFMRFVHDRADLDLTVLKDEDWRELRPELLAVKGIGPETADSILCYALGMPVFVVDAYTRRMLNRHGLIHEDATYQDMQDMFMDRMEANSEYFNEYHALIVRTAHNWCKKTNPLCRDCPLGQFLD